MSLEVGSVFVCVCVCVLWLDSMILRCLISPHQVNHDGVQNASTQVSLYKSHTTEESLRRHKSGRYSQVLPKVRKLFAASTTSERLCRWTPVALSLAMACRFLE